MAEPNRAVPAHRVQIERIFAKRTEAAARQEAEARTRLCAHRLRVERTAKHFQQSISAVLHDTAAILRERDLSAEVASVAPVGDPPRLAVRVAEPNANGHGPPKLLEGCLTFSATTDLASTFARARRPGAGAAACRRDAGTIPLADLNEVWVETCVLAFLNQLLLTDEPHHSD